MTEADLVDVRRQLYAVAASPPHDDWRPGQAVFNYAYDHWPEAADAIRGTMADCFYQNKNIDAFITGVVEFLRIRNRS